MTPDQKMLLKSWRDEIGTMMRAHHALSVRIRRMNYYLGIPLIAVAILIASYSFFTINYEPRFWMKMAVGISALLAAILASLQTFLKYSEQAENHRNASVRYQALYNSVDQMMAIHPKGEGVLDEWCSRLRERWDELNLEAPSVPRRLSLKHEREKERERETPVLLHEEESSGQGRELESGDTLGRRGPV